MAAVWLCFLCGFNLCSRNGLATHLSGLLKKIQRKHLGQSERTKAMQSTFVVNTCSWLEARENAWEQVVIRFWFHSAEMLKKWPEDFYVNCVALTECTVTILHSHENRSRKLDWDLPRGMVWPHLWYPSLVRFQFYIDKSQSILIPPSS